MDSTRDAAFSRSPIGGKKSSELKARVADELKFELARKAHSLGMNESQLIELYCSIGLFGVDHLARMQADTLETVGRLFPAAALSTDVGRAH